MSDLNGNCSDSMSETITSPFECIYAMEMLRGKNNYMGFEGVDFNGSFPKGCFFEDFKSILNVYWNHHSFGSKNIGSRQICTQDGKNQ